MTPTSTATTRAATRHVRRAAGGVVLWMLDESQLRNGTTVVVLCELCAAELAGRWDGLAVCAVGQMCARCGLTRSAHMPAAYTRAVHAARAASCSAGGTNPGCRR